jgi:hypothetical protein
MRVARRAGMKRMSLVNPAAPPSDSRILSKGPLPQAMADDDDAMFSPGFFIRAEPAAKYRADIQDIRKAD